MIAELYEWVNWPLVFMGSILFTGALLYIVLISSLFLPEKYWKALDTTVARVAKAFALCIVLAILAGIYDYNCHSSRYHLQSIANCPF